MPANEQRQPGMQQPDRRQLDVAFIGPPGSGKGTQARRFADKYGVCHLDVASMLRGIAAGKGPESQQMKSAIDQGRLIEDGQVCRLVEQQLDKRECVRGLLLDGFPRTTAQAERLDRMLTDRGRSLSAVVQFDVTDETATERITGRMQHLSSGRVYHYRFQPPKVPGRDDVTGEPLTKRPDDFPDVMPRRLAQYHELIGPVLRNYSGAGLLKRVDAGLAADSVWAALQRLFD